jgi:hypothetical protein
LKDGSPFCLFDAYSRIATTLQIAPSGPTIRVGRRHLIKSAVNEAYRRFAIRTPDLIVWLMHLNKWRKPYAKITVDNLIAFDVTDVHQQRRKGIRMSPNEKFRKVIEAAHKVEADFEAEGRMAEAAAVRKGFDNLPVGSLARLYDILKD